MITAIIALSLVDRLSENFKTTYPAGRLSFLALLDSGGTSVYALHSGDCRLGRLDTNGRLAWLSHPHTLANALERIGEEDLARHDDRHVLTRCFRPGRPCEIEVDCYSPLEDERLVIATDGYWADLDQEQKSGFVDGRFEPTASQCDDVSCLLLSPLPRGSDGAHQGNENVYIVRR